MKKFKIEDEVVVTDVHKRYGRTEKTVEKIEKLKEDKIIGEIITVDEEDDELDVYVSFNDNDNLWMNSGELEIKKKITKEYDAIGEITLTGTNVINYPLSVEQNKELSDETKVKLFDYLVEREGLLPQMLYEEYLRAELSDIYIEEFNHMLLDYEDIQDIFFTIIKDFNISYEVIKQVIENKNNPSN